MNNLDTWLTLVTEEPWADETVLPADELRGRLRTLVEALNEWKHNESRRTTVLTNDISDAVIALRCAFERQGMPDWSGRTYGYRQALAWCFGRSAISDDDQRLKVQGSIRYHVGNRLRDVAPLDHLHTLGLATRTPKERLTDARLEAAFVAEAIGRGAGEGLSKDVERISQNLTAYLERLAVDLDVAWEPDPDKASDHLNALTTLQTAVQKVTAVVRRKVGR